MEQNHYPDNIRYFYERHISRYLVFLMAIVSTSPFLDISVLTIALFIRYLSKIEDSIERLRERFFKS